MSRKQDYKDSGRMCSKCGHTSGRRRVCNRCSPRRAAQPHTDKYASKKETRA